MINKKRIFRVLLILLFINLIIWNKSYCLEENEPKLEEEEYTQAYKDWLNLPEEERAKTIMPRTVEIKDNGFAEKSSIRAKVESTLLPTYFNLRNKINMPVKNQKSTGGCWTFAALGSLESNLKLKKGISLDLSERHMDYATSNSFTTSNKMGCNREVNKGANEAVAIAYLSNGMGAILEDQMPFSEEFGTKDISYIQDKQVVTRVEDIIQFPSTNEITSSEEKDRINKKVKQHIMNYGAVTASVNSTTLSSPLYYNRHTFASYCEVEDAKINHEVMIVGWDDNFSKEKFNSHNMPTSDGAWIIQNSWGTSSGENGCFYISYEDKVIEPNFGIQNSNNEVDYSKIYQHDGRGAFISRSFLQEQIYDIEVFERNTTQEEQLTQIGVRLKQDSYCKIYVNAKNGNKSKLKLVKVKDYTLCSAGYHTINLDKPIELTGDKFVVAVEYYVPGGKASVFEESKNIERTNNIVPVEGNSFVTTKLYDQDSQYDSWDLAKKNSIGTVKAFTTFTTTDEPKITIGENSSVETPVYGKDGGRINVPITTKNIEDNSVLKVVIKKDNIDVTEQFTIRNNYVRNNSSKIIIYAPEGTKKGDYVAEISYGSIKKTTNFTIKEKTTTSISSKKYKIEEKYINKIEPKTTIEKFIENLTIDGNITIYDSKKQEVKNKKELIKTGMNVILSKEEAETIQLYTIVTGDTSADGLVQADDLADTVKAVLGDIDLSQIQFKAIDMSNNGKIEADDLADEVKLVLN